MKIGDKVRFLNAVGGGIVRGFQDKLTALVEDENGFEVPTLIKECVVVETDDYNIAKVHTFGSKKAKKAETASAAGGKTGESGAANGASEADDDNAEQPDLADLPMTYRPLAQERRGADSINLYLAFVKTDAADTQPDAAFDAYLVNDCNFFLRYTVLSHEGNAATLRYEGEIEPNTKIYLETFRRSGLAQWENLTLQAIAFKRTKSFIVKPPVHVRLRVEGSRFYKQGAFRPSPFFSAPALSFDLVRDDRPVRTVGIEVEEIKQAWYADKAEAPAFPAEAVAPARVGGAEARATRRQTAGAAKAGAAGGGNEPIVVDLHADALLDTMVGLTASDILDYQIKVFRDTLNAHLKQNGCRLVFIHGKGEGVLRRALLNELSARYKQVSVQDASFREYGYGATMVTV